MLNVKQVQTNLKYYYGYYKGNIDGKINKETIDAIKIFQKLNGLNVDGIYGKKTNDKLIEKIKVVQTLLNKKGFKLLVNGIIDNNTIQAIKIFQKKNKIKVDGIVGENTMRALQGIILNNVGKPEPNNKYSKYLIYINPGHGGVDSGAVRKSAGKILAKESDMNLSVSKYLMEYLKQMGFKTAITRTGDYYMSLADRAKKANNAKADLYVSVHFNAGGGDGLELIVNPSSEKGYKLATYLNNSVVKETVQNFRRYIKRDDADVTYSNMPAVIIEGCFMDSADFYLINTISKRQKLAMVYAKGIKSYIDSL
ncbi:N-acetylmuramoyl-L-alanine amidase [Anaerofustis sp. LCP19S3_F7]|uniref:N-acetylmuramoyl-L-alanine amidase n=1 Tax=Anaerofustis sp. LCP19S3_F7 TaxID=3440247 RepID=UPI003F8F7F31